MIRKKL